MEVPKILPRRRVMAPDDFDVRDYTDKIFWMFNGPTEKVTMRCSMNILDQVIDRFGEETEIKKADSNTFDVTVPVAVSGTFFAWVFQFTGEMQIQGPESVKEKYRNMLQDAMGDMDK